MVIDNIVVKIVEAKEGLDPFYYIRGLLIINCFNLLRVNFNFFYTNNKLKVLYLLYFKFKFLNIDLQAYILSFFKTFFYFLFFFT